LLEEDCRFFGGPFIILPWLSGVTLLDRLKQCFTRILGVSDQLARLHLALHNLPPAGFPAPAAPFLDRQLDELSAMIHAYELAGLKPGLTWLQAHRPRKASLPSILHLDFHPVNLMMEGDRPAGVLDWGESDLGDRHADIGMTLVLLRSAPADVSTRSERLLARPARWWMARRYLRAYARHFPLDRTVLLYYVAWAALRRLTVCGMWLREGPQVNGFKRSSLQYANRPHMQGLQDCFRQATGVTVRFAAG
jgi:aminoglycoside phosphotransferase (APT) family kinase protein